MGPTFALRQDHIDAISRAYREDLVRRLARYLEIHEPDLAAGVDLPAFADSAVDLASKHAIREEEGIAWLATILLSARRAKQPVDWMDALLDRLEKATNGTVPPEEDRLSQVHAEAAKRGIVTARDSDKEAA